MRASVVAIMRTCSIWNDEILIDAFPTPDPNVDVRLQCLTCSGPWLGGSAPPPKTQERAPSETLKFAHFCNRPK